METVMRSVELLVNFMKSDKDLSKFPQIKPVSDMDSIRNSFSDRSTREPLEFWLLEGMKFTIYYLNGLNDTQLSEWTGPSTLAYGTLFFGRVNEDYKIPDWNPGSVSEIPLDVFKEGITQDNVYKIEPD